METLSSFFDSRSYDSLKNFRRISPDVQNHLKRVYLILCCSELVYAIGAYLHMIWNIGGILTTLGGIGSKIWLHSSPPQQSSMKLSLFFLNAFLEGASASFLIRFATNIDPSFLIAGYMGTALAFVCYLAAVMFARRRKYLYFVALLSSSLSIFMFLQFISVFNLKVYGGHLLVVVDIVVITQEIIEKANNDDKDYMRHSLHFFGESLVGFVLKKKSTYKKKEKKQEKKEKKKRGRN